VGPWLRRTAGAFLLAIALVAPAAGCDETAVCEAHCDEMYEDCLESGETPIACDRGLDDCLDRCWMRAAPASGARGGDAGR